MHASLKKEEEELFKATTCPVTNDDKCKVGHAKLKKKLGEDVWFQS